MAYGGYSYMDPEYEPDENDFVALFWVKGQENIETLAEAIASESSVGTWTQIQTMNEHVLREYRARIYRIEKTSEHSGFVFIAYPFEHFDSKNIAQFQASVLGNIFGLKELEELYVLDISFPKRFQRQFKGPRFGIKGVRKRMGTVETGRPHVGTIVKPKVGLAPQEFARVAGEAWRGGLDLVKDDENLVDQDFCTWKERLDHVLEEKDRAEKETGEKKMYCTNITDSSIDRMLERLDYVRERGHDTVMLDVYVLGIPAVAKLLEVTRRYRLVVHAHRAGYAAWHRGSFGVSFQILEKLYRILGVDQIHVGTGVGKMEGGALLIKRLHEICEHRHGEQKLYLGSLEYEFAPSIRPVMPVASGGLDPGRVEALVELHGNNVVIQAGGGVHGHPDGTLAGARAMRQAVEAVARGESLEEAARRHHELARAIEKFGIAPREPVKKILEFEKQNKHLLERLVLSGRLSFRQAWGL